MTPIQIAAICRLLVYLLAAGGLVALAATRHRRVKGLPLAVVTTGAVLAIVTLAGAPREWLSVASVPNALLVACFALLYAQRLSDARARIAQLEAALSRHLSQL